LQNIVTDEKKGEAVRRSTYLRKEVGEGKQPQATENQQFEKQKKAKEEELPPSLQRVRSRRVEEMTGRFEKTRSREVREGKRVDKPQ
jgi:hypothetical protein